MKIFVVIIMAHRVIWLIGADVMSKSLLPPYILRHYDAKVVLCVR